jgi:hypothetical protein
MAQRSPKATTAKQSAALDDERKRTQRTLDAPALAPQSNIARMQAAVGNRATSQMVNRTAAPPIQRLAVQNVNAVGKFRDVGNGLFGSDTPVNANDVLQVVRAIRTSDEATGARTNIKILTGTHGTATGHLVGEQIFFQEDLANEGHKGGGGWVNVLGVRNKSKSTISGWKDSRNSFAVILAWCYSAKSEENWANVHATWKKGDDGKHVWAW